MKIRPLPEIDLARIATLPFDQQRKQLEQIIDGHPPFSYNPLRAGFADIFNIQPALFGAVEPTDWSVVAEIVGKKCKSDDEAVANLRVAKGLHHFTTENRTFGRAKEFFPMTVSVGRKVIYWLPMVLAIEGRPLIPFIDPRRSRRLTQEARRFVFSMMHERIRAADPDYADVRFGIFQFGDPEEDVRSPKLHADTYVSLFSLGELESMIRVTYELWREVCEEREAVARRKADGTRGPLGI